MYCADCFWKVQAEYDKKKTCEECGSFDETTCQVTGKVLIPSKVGFGTYFLEAENCKHYSTEKKGSSKNKNRELSEAQKEAAALVKTLSEKGRTLTLYCCHCGAPQKIGGKSQEVQKTCPRCQGDLEIVDLSKFIKQHSLQT